MKITMILIWHDILWKEKGILRDLHKLYELSRFYDIFPNDY